MECNYGLFSFPPTADAGDEDECWRCSHCCCKYSATCELPNIIITRPCTLPSTAIAKLAKQKGNIPGWNGPMLHSAKCPAAVVSTVSGAIVHRHHSDRVAGKPLFACKIFLPSRSTLLPRWWRWPLGNNHRSQVWNAAVVDVESWAQRGKLLLLWCWWTVAGNSSVVVVQEVSPRPQGQLLLGRGLFRSVFSRASNEPSRRFHNYRDDLY